MSGRPGSIAIVIRCHNEGRHVGRLLRGIAAQSVEPDEIVAVDSGSTDDTVDVLERAGVRVLRLDPAEFSFGRSLNLGISATSSDLVVIASAHVYPLYDTWLELLTAPFTRPDVALVYGRQVGTDDSNYAERRIFARWYPHESVDVQDDPFCNNANAAIRRSVWERAPYDEALTGLEDLDWAKRAMQRGLVVAYCAQACIAHVHDETWTQVVNRYRREAIAHKAIYHDQRMHLVRALGLAASNIASDWAYAARNGQLLTNAAAIASFRLAQFLGTYRGFTQRGPVSRKLLQRFYYPGETAHDRVAHPPFVGDGHLIDYDAPSHEADAAAR